MFIVIVIIVAVIIMISLISNQKQNKGIKNHHLSEGGLRKFLPIFTNYLETFYKMQFVNDTGREFTYSKQIKDVNEDIGTLTIGVKYDIRNELLLFSNFKNSFHSIFKGLDVTGVNFENISSIEKCINISIDKIKSQGILSYENSKNNIKTPSKNSEYYAKWNDIKKTVKAMDSLVDFDAYLNLFFIPDSINPDKFIENLDILHNQYKGFEDGYGTKSVKGFFYIPPAWGTLIVAAYPDVFKWCQRKGDGKKIEIDEKLSKLSDEEAEEYFNDTEKVKEFYRSLINQFKREGNKLECS